MLYSFFLPYLGLVEAEDSLAEADVVLVCPALGEVAFEGVLIRLGRVDRVICGDKEKNSGWEWDGKGL